MLEKYGMFKDWRNYIWHIYKDRNGYIDITLNSEENVDYITVPVSYDLEGKNIISIRTLLEVISDVVKGKRKNQLVIYVENFGENENQEFMSELYSKFDILKKYYNFISLKYAYLDMRYLDIQFVKNMLHSQSYSCEDERMFNEWVRKNRIVNKQREDYISWDEYFMAISKLSAMRSKDPNTQVGACIVSEDNRLLSIGYNGAPNGYKDYKFPWDREGENLKTKYPFVVHAERNAILNYRGSRQDFIGARIYVDLFPCNECAKEIIQAGISEVIYLSDKYADTESTIASKMLLDECGVKYRQLGEEYRKVLTIDLRK